MEIGQKLPDYLGVDQDGKEVRTSYFKGKKLVTELGVYGEKMMYGKVTMGTLRTTFVADEDGTIVEKYGPKDIKVKEHAEQILEK